MGRCAQHPEVDAVSTCARCGGFVCKDCRSFYDYVPLCGSCLERRDHSAPASQRSRLALIMAILGFVLVVLPFGVPAVVLAQMELSAIERGEAPEGGRGYARAAALLGWGANLVFAMVLLIVAGFAGLIMYGY